MRGPSAEEQYVKPGEAARLLHVSPKTIDRWALAGRIPCIVTLGGHRRFRMDHILAVAEQMATTSATAEERPSSSTRQHSRGK